MPVKKESAKIMIKKAFNQGMREGYTLYHQSILPDKSKGRGEPLERVDKK